MQFAETSFHLTPRFNNNPSVNDNSKFSILHCNFDFYTLHFKLYHNYC